MKKILIIMCCGILSACGGGGGSEENENIVGTAGILSNIEVTNLDSSVFPWTNGTAEGKLKRWDYLNTKGSGGLIPVQDNGIQIATNAMDEIEEKIGVGIGGLFNRTTVTTRGLIVSSGTALGAGGLVDETTCGHVASDNTGSTSYPSNFYNATGVIDTILYINLSSSGCTADTDIAIHEFGHALGLGEHFDGFGLGDVINNNFWNVLYNIYINTIGSDENDLTGTVSQRFY